jgi:hypothetical protein
MITVLKKLAIFRCRTRQTYVLLFLGVAFVFVSTIIGSFIFRTPPPPPRCSYITPYIGIICSPYQTFRNGLEHYKLLEGRYLYETGTGYPRCFDEVCVAKLSLCFGVFFVLYVFVVSECFSTVDANTNNSTLVGLYTCGSVLYKNDLYMSTQLQTSPH